MASDEDGIIKLVFLQEANTGRKAVVPLVEGVDWEAFLARVRSRLGLPVGHTVQLHDETSQPIDSIDRLLEADESSTLRISFIAAAAAEMPASSASATAAAQRRPAAQTPGGASSGASAGADDCRVDIATSPGVLGPYAEDGELKYRKRRCSTFIFTPSSQGSPPPVPHYLPTVRPYECLALFCHQPGVF